MKKYSILTLSILQIFAINVAAQESLYKISEYKLPEIERRTLDANINLSGYSQSSDSKSKRFNSDVYLDYNYFKNSDRLQKEVNWQIDLPVTLRSSFSELNNYSQLSKENSLAPHIYFDKYHRVYKENNFFTEANIFIDYYYNRRVRKYESDGSPQDTMVLRSHFLTLSTPIKTGKGRIEQIQDVRHALYIVDDLHKKDRLQKSQSREDINQLASLISELKNDRYFDSRIRKISELQAIDSFLSANNYLTENDIVYFATLQDIWSYGNRPVRKSGQRISTMLQPGMFFNKEKNHNYITNYQNYYSTAAFIDYGIEFISENPLDLYWQNSLEINAYAGYVYGVTKDLISSESTKFNIPNIQFGLYHTIAYYPNTRTDISLSSTAQYLRLIEFTNPSKGISGTFGRIYRLSSMLTINYYISPQLRVSSGVTAIYSNQSINNEMNLVLNELKGSRSIFANLDPNFEPYPDQSYLYFHLDLIYSFF